LQHNFLDVLYTRSQDFFMPTPPVKEEDALFIVRVVFLREEKLIQLTFEKGKLIEQLMTDDELEDTGVGSLTDRQKAELNAWLNPDRSRIATMRTQDFSMPPVAEKNRKKNRYEKSAKKNSYQRLRSFRGHDKHREG
jgi:hypothetical protein